MGFWIFMLVMNLLVSLTSRINSVFGYRTERSMKNSDTWDFAHRYAGKIWLRLGWVSTVGTVLAMLPLIGKPPDTIGTWGAVITFLLLIPLCAVVPMTEWALRQNFDDFGRRKHRD